jgi:hypothetical protein
MENSSQTGLSLSIFDIDSYIMVALNNLRYSDDDLLRISMELDRLIFEEDIEIIKKQANKLNKKILPELFIIEFQEEEKENDEL